MTDFLLPVPENPPDEGDFLIIGFNREWLPIVLTALQTLRDASLWQDGEELEIIPQLDELMTLIMTDLDP